MGNFDLPEMQFQPNVKSAIIFLLKKVSLALELLEAKLSVSSVICVEIVASGFILNL